MLASIRHPSGVALAIGQRRAPYGGNTRTFEPKAAWGYSPFRHDFGPPDLYALVCFAREVELQLQLCAEADQHTLAYCVDPRDVTNAVFLLGGYMILMLETPPARVAASFVLVDVAQFCDVSERPSDFGLAVRDCWDGLYRAQQLNWIRRPWNIHDPQWGRFNMDCYEHYSDPLNADLHEIVPGVLVAFRGPMDIQGDYVDEDSLRHFSPAYYARVLGTELGVKAVVRLGGAKYDPAPFGRHYHDVEFEDCTEPSRRIVRKVFAIVDRTPGAVAFHCLAGLGRTGTLIALCLMRTYKFRARAAIGWLRIVRPGSVIGSQQQFLCDVEQRMAEPPSPLVNEAGGALAAVACGVLMAWAGGLVWGFY